VLAVDAAIGLAIMTITAAQIVALAFRRQPTDGPVLSTAGATPIAETPGVGVRA
jgi:hypothetical protein